VNTITPQELKRRQDKEKLIRTKQAITQAWILKDNISIREIRLHLKARGL